MQPEKDEMVLCSAVAYLTDLIPPCIFGICQVCSAEATGIHYAVSTCEGCKGFFKRSLLTYRTFKCYFGGNCYMSPETRALCKACRFQKCLQVGMSPDGNRVRAHAGSRTAPTATTFATTHNVRPTTPSSSSSVLIQTAQNGDALSSYLDRHRKQHQKYQQFGSSTQVVDPSSIIIGGYLAAAVRHTPRQPVPPSNRYMYVHAPATQQQQLVAQNMQQQQQQNNLYTVRSSPAMPPASPPSPQILPSPLSSYPRHKNKTPRLDLKGRYDGNDVVFQNHRPHQMQQSATFAAGVVQEEEEEIVGDTSNKELFTGITRSSSSATRILQEDYPNIIMQYISGSDGSLLPPECNNSFVAGSKPFYSRELQQPTVQDDHHQTEEQQSNLQPDSNKIDRLVDNFDSIVCGSIVTHLYTEWSNHWMPNLLTARYTKQFLGETLSIYQPVVDIHNYMTALMRAMNNYDFALEQFAQAIPGGRALDETLNFFATSRRRHSSFLSTFCVTFCEVLSEHESHYAFQREDDKHMHWLTQTNYWFRTVSPPGALEIFWHMTAYFRSLNLSDTARALVVAALIVRPQRDDYERLPQFVRDALPVKFFSLPKNDWAASGEQIFLFVVNVLAAHVAREYTDSHERLMRNLNHVFNALACKMDVLDELMLQSIPFTFDVNGTFDWQHLRNFTANENLLPLDVRQWLKDGWKLLY